MATGSHFGCLKIIFDRISGNFRSIRNSFVFNFWQNGHRRPFWMSEIHFRSHFWPFQIDRPFLVSEIHFRWHIWTFQIDTELFYLFLFLQNGHRRSFWMSENHFRSHFWPFQIDMELNTCVKFEERSLNPSKVIALTTKLWRGWLGGCVADENMIFPKTCVSREYN